MEHLAQIWAEHGKHRFPTGYGGTEIDGIDLAMLDGDIAGCVSTAVSTDGKLDGNRLKILADCHKDALLVIPKLEKDAKIYFERLEHMARLVLERNGWKRQTT